MTFLAPFYLAGAGVLAALAIALHFLSTRAPDAAAFPPARFIPMPRTEYTVRAVRLRDVGLLVLRVAAVLLVGAALARPVFPGRRRQLARVVMVDRSTSARDARAVADSARKILERGDALVLFDSTVSTSLGAQDSLPSFATRVVRGNLSAAFAGALRVASALRESADSIEFVLISPLVRAELDAATDSVRALWPGGIRIVRVPARLDSTTSGVDVRADATDPIRFALDDGVPARMGTTTTTQPSTRRLIRSSLGADDSAWVRQAGHVAIFWPDSVRALNDVDWSPLSSADTAGALVANDAVVVAPFRRAAEYRGRANARVVARWVDGLPAVIEEPLGAGCIRTVAVTVPGVGDLVLEARFHRFVSALLAPCGGAPDLTPLSGEEVARIAGTRPLRVPSTAIAHPSLKASPLTWSLLVLALVLLLLELVVRRGIPRTEMT